MSRKTVLWLAVLLIFTVAGLAGCGKQEQAAGPKVLKVGTEATFPPFEFQEEGGKDYTGFDIDIAKAIGKQMGYQVEVSNLSFDGLIPALDAGNIDMIAAGMTITPEREKKVNFTEPYCKSGLSILVKKDNTSIKGFKDLTGKRIAVQIGTTSARKAHGIANATVKEFNSNSEAYMELKNGGVDAVINDSPVNDYYLTKSGDKEVKALPEIIDADSYGIATAKKNVEFSKKVDEALKEIKKNGEYDKIYQKWFGKKPE